MMNETNPQIEQQLDALTQLCCESVNGDNSALIERSDALLKSLLMSGYDRKAGHILAVDLEARIRNRCPGATGHRGAELSGITLNLQEEFDKLVQWESNKPQDTVPSKTANISSATDA